MQEKMYVSDCKEEDHLIEVDNVKNITSEFHHYEKVNITTIHFKKVWNNLWDIKTYESENSFRDRFSKLYGKLHPGEF